jgi:hypothetical protein
MANSRYPNMSYCMFENTQLAMAQLLENMREALEEGTAAEFFADMSSDEQRAFNELYNMSEDFLAVAADLEDAKVVDTEEV